MPNKTCSFTPRHARLDLPGNDPVQESNPRGQVLVMGNFAPTEEQSKIRDAFVARNGNMKVRALAGSGKTSTLDLLARSRPDRMTYAAFNRAIAEYARSKFPSNVTCNTLHAFAYAVMGKKFKHRMNAGHIPSHRVANILRLPNDWEYGDLRLRSFQLVSLVNEAVQRFCSSADDVPSGRFLPRVPGIETPAARQALSSFLLPFVNRAWEDLTSLNGQLRFDHYVYLKLWGMNNPVLPGSVILFDEAQDATPLTRSIVMMQNAEVIAVGDEYQQLYPWMGAINALEHFEVPEGNDLTLTKSFRFGPAIAEEANLILGLLGAPIRVEGHEPVQSSLAYLNDPETVLCRTNSEAVARLLAAQAAGVKAGLVGGTAHVKKLAQAALDLTSGRKTSHPDLIAFDNWGQVCDYVDSDGANARDLQVLVKLVNRYGAQQILDAVERAVPVDKAHLKISTGHKAKGLEWDSVKLAGDFPPPYDEEGNLRKDELCLAYVAVTRAKRFLDTSIAGSNYAMDNPRWDWLSEAAVEAGVTRQFMEADQVPVREVIEVHPEEEFQLICDPGDRTKLVFRRTKYDPDLVAAQRDLPRRSFKAEYNGDEKVNIVLATVQALTVAEKFGLSVSPAALARVEERAAHSR